MTTLRVVRLLVRLLAPELGSSSVARWALR
jgi:hypothetical protein